MLLVAMAMTGGVGCMAQDLEHEEPRVLPPGPIEVEPETKTVVEVCDECAWVESETPTTGEGPAEVQVDGGGTPEAGTGTWGTGTDTGTGTWGTGTGTGTGTWGTGTWGTGTWGTGTSGTGTSGTSGNDTGGGSDTSVWISSGTDGGAGATTGGGESGGSSGTCMGECPSKEVGGETITGECTEIAAEDCRCVYEIPKDSLTIKVLVTGFADFDELNDPYEVDDNPSGRLLTGAATTDFRGEVLDGPLVTWLEANAGTSECGVAIDYDFEVLPVLWETAKDNIDYCEYDFVISMGVGPTAAGTLDLEQDAGNGRSGNDVNGNPPPSGQIDPNLPATATIKGHDSVRDRVQGQHGQTHGIYTVNVVPARPQNCYICNETHCTGLITLDEQQEACATDCALDGVFFIHLPDVSVNAALAAGVGGLIEDLVQPF